MAVIQSLLLFWLLACVCQMGCNSSRFHYLENATVVEDCPASEGRPPAVALLLVGHHVGRGRAVVLIARTFDRGSLMTIDDESYKKLTIELANFEPGVPIEVPGPGVRVFYTSGSPAFVQWAVGASSTDATGSIVIYEKISDRLTVKIDLVTLVREPSRPADAAPRLVRIEESRTFTKIELEDLTPWLGVCHPSPGREVYP